MDLSKLPKLSQTDAPPPAMPEDPVRVSPQPVQPIEAAPTDAPHSKAAPGDVWISIGIGVLMLFLYPRFLSWVSSVVFHTSFNQFLKDDGTVVPYPHVPEFWGDLGPTLFGLVLIAEGIALMLSRKRMMMLFAFALTVIATGYNAIYLLYSYNKYGLAIVSAFAVVFGVYIAMYQRTLLREMNLQRSK